MKTVLILSAGVAIAVTLRGTCSAHRRIAGTTLVAAWRWSLLATLAWLLAWILSILPLVSTAFLDQVWYAVGLLMLCAPVAVLGARRPGSGAWTGFVVLPLLAVLGWPLLTVWTAEFEPRPLRLETPVLLGYVLVLMMGLGNYLGTRCSISAAVYGMAACLVVGSVSTLAPAEVQGSPIARHLAALVLAVSYLVAAMSTRRRGQREIGFDQLWEDYRDTFGIVWGKRLQDRVNGIAQQQQWQARLEQEGFVWSDDATPSQREETARKIDQTLRWLLRRFVDPEWIDARLTREQPSVVSLRATEDRHPGSAHNDSRLETEG